MSEVRGLETSKEKKQDISESSPEKSRFDSESLLKSYTTVLGKPEAQSTNGKEAVKEKAGDKSTPSEGEHLLVDNAFAALSATDTRAVKAKAEKKAHEPQTLEIPPTIGKATEASAPITIVGRPEKFVPERSTVLFLDNFSKDRTNMASFGPGAGGAPHGEVSARAAEVNGFNVIRAQANDAPFNEMFRDIEKRINSGELPLGKGDVINVSMGHNDLTFAQVSEFTGIKITAENLAENKDKILDKLREISKTHENLELRQAIAGLVETNEIINRLQTEKKITVVHAAGNDGPDKFSIDFMNAKVQLGSQNPETKKFDSFSAAHSLETTDPANGVFGITTGWSQFSTLPLARDKGYASLIVPNGNPVSFPISGLFQSAIATDGKYLDRSALGFNDHKIQIPDAPLSPLPYAALSSTASGFESKLQVGGPKQFFNSGMLKSPVANGPLIFSDRLSLKNVNNEISFSNTVPTDTMPRIAGVVAGTSFSNIGWLSDHRDELEKSKRGN